MRSGMFPGYNYPFAVFVDGFYLCFWVVNEFHPVGEELPAHFAKFFFEVLGHPFHVEGAFAFFETGSAFVAVFCGGYVDGSAGGECLYEEKLVMLLMRRLHYPENTIREAVRVIVRNGWRVPEE